MPFDGTSKSPVGSGASQSTIVLNLMEFFFDGGARWACRTYCTHDGKCCLLGALEYVRCETRHRDDRAVQYLARAINLRQLAKGLPLLGNTDTATIIGFNDSFGRSFADVAAVLSDAKQLSAIDCR
jgi:hypothetical protein